MAFDDLDMIRNQPWPGDTLCMKKKGDGLMGYSEFGIIVNRRGPTVVFLRGDTPQDDWEQKVSYESVEAMLADGWMVD